MMTSQQIQYGHHFKDAFIPVHLSPRSSDFDEICCADA